jgi:hypothetical protein
LDGFALVCLGFLVDLFYSCKEKMKRKFNKKVVVYSLIALGFIALTFLVNQYFIVGAIIFMLINQKEIMKSRGQ